MAKQNPTPEEQRAEIIAQIPLDLMSRGDRLRIGKLFAKEVDNDEADVVFTSHRVRGWATMTKKEKREWFSTYFNLSTVPSGELQSFIGSLLNIMPDNKVRKIYRLLFK